MIVKRGEMWNSGAWLACMPDSISFSILVDGLASQSSLLSVLVSLIGECVGGGIIC